MKIYQSQVWAKLAYNERCSGRNFVRHQLFSSLWKKTFQVAFATIELLFHFATIT